MIDTTRSTPRRRASRASLALLAALPLLALGVPALAQDSANSRPQPVASPHVIPLPDDVPYPGIMELDIDASDIARGIIAVR